jgi:tetratricopeptide (TPR) repeat protein
MASLDRTDRKIGSSYVLQRAFGLLAFSLWLAQPTLTSAQADSELSDSEQTATPAAEPERAQQAELHFDRGLELYREGDPDAALVEFERANALVPNFRLLYNMAQIQVERHQYAAAMELFEDYLAQGGEAIQEARRQTVQQELLKLQERVARLWVESDVAGAKLYVSDQLVAELPLAEPILINSGICHIRVEKAGYRSAETELKVAGGDAPRVRLALGEPGGASDAEAASASPRNTTRSYTPFWISAASTVALAGAATAFGLLARSDNRELDRELARVPASATRLSDLRSQLKLHAGLTDGFAVASLVSALIAVYFATDPPERPVRAPAVARLRTLRVTPGDRGLTLHGMF